VSVGSCIQIALFVIPLLVLIGWIADKPMSLLFDPLETITLFLSVLLVRFATEDGRTHYMSGVALFGTCVYFCSRPRRVDADECDRCADCVLVLVLSREWSVARGFVHVQLSTDSHSGSGNALISICTYKYTPLSVQYHMDSSASRTLHVYHVNWIQY
jgi:hypothetical protein